MKKNIKHVAQKPHTKENPGAVPGLSGGAAVLAETAH